MGLLDRPPLDMRVLVVQAPTPPPVEGGLFTLDLPDTDKVLSWAQAGAVVWAADNGVHGARIRGTTLNFRPAAGQPTLVFDLDPSERLADLDAMKVESLLGTDPLAHSGGLLTTWADAVTRMQL